MLRFGIVRVLSLSTPYPSRVHLMDKEGYVLCDNNHLRFCLAEAHRDYVPHIPTCIPCADAYERLIRPDIFERAYLKL